jgi:hypothetical protein
LHHSGVALIEDLIGTATSLLYQSWLMRANEVGFTEDGHKKRDRGYARIRED